MLKSSQKYTNFSEQLPHQILSIGHPYTNVCLKVLTETVVAKQYKQHKTLYNK